MPPFSAFLCSISAEFFPIKPAPPPNREFSPKRIMSGKRAAPSSSTAHTTDRATRLRGAAGSAITNARARRAASVDGLVSSDADIATGTRDVCFHIGDDCHLNFVAEDPPVVVPLSEMPPTETPPLAGTSLPRPLQSGFVKFLVPIWWLKAPFRALCLALYHEIT